MPGPVVCVQAAVMSDSSVMAVVPMDVRARFNTALTTEWLPDKSVGDCLYRGSRDCMTPRTFHAACDWRGATLTLIRADEGEASYVFGGYASTPWSSERGYFGCIDAFLFSVTSPHADGSMVRFPLKPGQEGKAMYCHGNMGPTFGGGHDVCVCGGGVDKAFSALSFCNLGLSFEDVLGKGDTCFTGSRFFTPVDVEVYSVL